VAIVDHKIKWNNDATNTAPEERATVGDFHLTINGQPATTHNIANTVCHDLVVSLYGLTAGLTHDWWSIFGGRDRVFSFVRYRNGYLLPDVRLSFDGAAFEISAHQFAYPESDVRFWNAGHEVLTRQDAERALDTLITKVNERLEDRGILGSGAQVRWARVLNSRQDPDEAAFCEAAGALGKDPYRIDDATAADIERAADLFEGEARLEMLAGAKDSDRTRVFDWIEATKHRPSSYSRVANLSDIAARAAQIGSPNGRARWSWELGYQRARAMRRVLNLGTDARFASYKDIAKLLGAGPSFRPSDTVNGLRALRSESGNGPFIHLRKHAGGAAASASYLFTFARAVGDVACYPESGRAVVNDLKNAARQAAGRAFAAEFLAPLDEIESMQENGRDVTAIAEDFHVSTQVIEHQIENRDRIRRACASI